MIMLDAITERLRCLEEHLELSPCLSLILELHFICILKNSSKSQREGRTDLLFDKDFRRQALLLPPLERGKATKTNSPDFIRSSTLVKSDDLQQKV